MSSASPLIPNNDLQRHERFGCAFCRRGSSINRRRIAANAAAEAFLSIQPIVPGHTLIVPRRCVASFGDLLPDEINKILGLRDVVRSALQRAFSAEGFNYAWNEGEVAGQTVPHFHLHVVPRTSGDAGVQGCDPRRFLYRPGPREGTEIRDIENVAALIRAQMGSDLTFACAS